MSGAEEALALVLDHPGFSELGRTRILLTGRVLWECSVTLRDGDRHDAYTHGATRDEAVQAMVYLIREHGKEPSQ